MQQQQRPTAKDTAADDSESSWSNADGGSEIEKDDAKVLLMEVDVLAPAGAALTDTMEVDNGAEAVDGAEAQDTGDASARGASASADAATAPASASGSLSSAAAAAGAREPSEHQASASTSTAAHAATTRAPPGGAWVIYKRETDQQTGR